jgi:hypothetical protein
MREREAVWPTTRRQGFARTLLFLRVAADQLQPLFGRFLVLLGEGNDFLVFGLEASDLQR